MMNLIGIENVTIRTSYVGNHRKFNKGALRVYICRTLKQGLSEYGRHSLDFAPSHTLLSSFKVDRAFGVDEFKRRYFLELDGVPVGEKLEILIKLSGIGATQGNSEILLLCYEKPPKFCHRHLFAEYVKENFNYIIEEL